MGKFKNILLRTTAVAMGTILALETIPAPVKVIAAPIQRNTISFGTEVWGNPTSISSTDTTAEWEGDKLYLGEYNGTPILWNILDSEMTNVGEAGAFLLSDEALDKAVYGAGAGYYKNSTLKTTIEDIYTALNSTNPSVGGIFDNTSVTTLNSNSLDASVGADGVYDCGEFTNLHFFAPSAYEMDAAKYGFNSKGHGGVAGKSRIGNRNAYETVGEGDFWLRSFDIESPDYIGVIREDGRIWSADPDVDLGIAIASNIDTTKISYTIAKDINRVASLHATTTKTDNSITWDVILKDPVGGNNEPVVNIEGEYLNKVDTIKVTMTHPAMENTATQVTAMLVDDDGNIAAFGKVANAGDDEFTITYPSGSLAEGTYYLYIVDEYVPTVEGEVGYISGIYGDDPDEKTPIKVSDEEGHEEAEIEIVLQPEDVTVTEGETAYFNINAKNAVGHEWYYRTSPEGAWDLIASDDYTDELDTLKIPDTVLDWDGYQFYCKVLGTAGSSKDSNIVTLHVKKKEDPVKPDPGTSSSSSEKTSSSTVYISDDEDEDSSSKKKKKKKHNDDDNSGGGSNSGGGNIGNSAQVVPNNVHEWTDEDWANYYKALAIMEYNEAATKVNAPKTADESFAFRDIFFAIIILTGAGILVYDMRKKWLASKNDEKNKESDEE